MKKIYFSMMALAIAAFTFTSCEDVPEPYNNPYDQIKPSEPEVVIEPAGSGTAEDPYNVAAIIEQTASLADGEFFNNSENVYVTGVVVETKEVSAQYGNATYYIADNAKSADRFYVYRGKLLDGASVAAETDLEVGDSVTVCGKIKNYKGTLEFDQGNYLTFIKKGEGGGETPSSDEVGSKDAPKTVTETLAAINAMEDGATSTEFWYVKGKVVKVTTNQASFDQYKNLNYLISEDGTESNTITVYAGNGLDNTQFSGIDALKQGDEVVVYGHIQKYVKNDKMTPEIAKGNYLVKYTAAGGQGGGEGGAKGSGTQADPFNVAGVINATASLGTGEFYNNGAEVYVSGIVTETKDINTKYGNATYYISDDKSASNKFYVYRGKLLDGASVTAETDLQVGDEVTVCGKIKNYNGTIEFDQGNYLTALKKGEGGGNDGGGGTVDGSSIIVVYGDLGITDLSSAITLTDGTTLTFSQEDGKNPPIYHANTSIIRMYAHNSVTINASKKISKVVFAYDTYQGTAYKGNDQMYGQAGSNKITPTKDDKNVTFSNVNNSTLKVVNDFDTNSGGTQFRCTGVTITYAAE